jgi:hypothetical protein
MFYGDISGSGYWGYDDGCKSGCGRHSFSTDGDGPVFGL